MLKKLYFVYPLIFHSLYSNDTGLKGIFKEFLSVLCLFVAQTIVKDISYFYGFVLFFAFVFVSAFLNGSVFPSMFCGKC